MKIKDVACMYHMFSSLYDNLDSMANTISDVPDLPGISGAHVLKRVRAIRSDVQQCKADISDSLDDDKFLDMLDIIHAGLDMNDALEIPVLRLEQSIWAEVYNLLDAWSVRVAKAVLEYERAYETSKELVLSGTVTPNETKETVQALWRHQTAYYALEVLKCDAFRFGSEHNPQITFMAAVNVIRDNT